MFRTMSVVLVAVLATATVSLGDAYSTGFEYADMTEMQNDGWVFTQNTPNFETTVVRTGQKALRLLSRVCVERPVNEFGTLNLWVYDQGIIHTENRAGYRWGLSKGEEVIGAHMFHRSWMDSAVAYGANTGFANATGGARLGQWHSSTWVDAGDLSNPVPGVDDSRSRGVVGWCNWEIIYNPDGTIEINLLEDPNDPGVPRGHSGHTVGEAQPTAPDSLEFIDPGTGGAQNIYLFGSWDNDGGTPPVGVFGELIVDDLTWTPAAAGPQADFDNDGDVDLDDFVILKNNFGLTPPANGDADGDGDVDLDDFVILKNEFGS